MIEARLSGAAGSRISHRGDPIEATIIAPISADGQIVVPQGSKLIGSIASASPIGLGIKHSHASITFGFDKLLLPNGDAIPVHAQLMEVDTAKEYVDDQGAVRGIHPIASFSSSLTFYVVPLLLVNPAVGAPVWGVKSMIAPSANSEIGFPTGTEMLLRLSSAVTFATGNADFSSPTQSLSPGDLEEIEQMLKNSAQRARMGGHPSDMVNLLLIGNRSALDRAFYASGWSQAHRKSPASLYRMYLALTKRIGYPRAPMNALTLNGMPSSFVQQKSLNTVQKRHHVRLWQYPGRENVWLGTAAEDIGFKFRWLHWTHSTDPRIDSERAKVVNDLAFVGCVDAAGLMTRDSADLVQDPKAEFPIQTDGDIVAVRLNDCVRPNVMAGVVKTPGAHKRGPFARTLSMLGHELVRSNILFTAYNTVKLIGGREAKSTAAFKQPAGGVARRLDWLRPATRVATHSDLDGTAGGKD